MPMPNGLHLGYHVATRTVPLCWSIMTTMDFVTDEMNDLFEKNTEPITSVWVERWENGVLKETIHLYPDCAAEGLAS